MSSHDPDSTVRTWEGSLLIVDDNPQNVEIVATRLQFRGYDVVHAASGTAALKASTAEAIEVIILNLVLPDIDGFEITRQIRGTPRGRDIGIIAIGETTDVRNEVAALDAGADDYLSKPLTFPVLEARIGSLLRGARRRRDRV